MPLHKKSLKKLLTSRYMAAVSLVGLVVTLSYIGLVLTIMAEHAEYRIVGLARQQNAEIAGALHLARLTAYAPDPALREAYRAELRRAIQRLEGRHHVFSLERGTSNIPHHIKRLIRNIYDEQDIDEQMEDFIRDARKVAASGGGVSDLNQLDANHTALVPGHTRMFELLRMAGADESERIKMLATAQWLLALGVLVTGVMWLLRPMVKAREEAAIAQAAREGQASFIRTVNHELRTPLNAILGMTQLLQMRGLPPKENEYVLDIQHAGEHLLGLINRVLDLSRIEARQVAISRTPTTLDEILEEVVNLLRPLAAQKSLDLRYRRAADLSGQYLADTGHIHQVLVNLIGNAIKFTEKGWVEVRAVAAQPEKSGVINVCFEVEDTGIGVSPDMREAIFEEFQQADDRLARSFGGTGLGLAICRGLVRLMGGKIGLDGEKEKGSLFWFVVPLERAAATG